MNDKDIQNMIRELLDLEEGLSEWEVNFLDSIVLRSTFTDKQSSKVEQIWNARIGNKR